MSLGAVELQTIARKELVESKHTSMADLSMDKVVLKRRVSGFSTEETFSNPNISPWTLFFGNPELEGLFRLKYEERFALRTQKNLIYGLMLYSIPFAALEPLDWEGEISMWRLIIRLLAITLPLALLVAWDVVWYRKHDMGEVEVTEPLENNPGLTWQPNRTQWIVSVVGLTVGLGHGGYHLLNANNQESVEVMAIAMLILLLPTLGHMRFLWTLVVSHIIVGVTVIESFLPGVNDDFSQKRVILNSVCLIVVNWVVCLVAWKNEWQERVFFFTNTRLKVANKNEGALLSKMLPAKVIGSINSGVQTVAERHSSVSILFSDFEKFAKLSTTTEATEIVRFLDVVFSIFDECTEHQLCYKVETVGSTYLAAAGVPDETDDHAIRICRLGIAMMQAMEEVCEVAANVGLVLGGELGSSLRIGIHSGTVIAGVIGQNLPRYRLFGDTVNTASRMCSSADVNSIQVSPATYDLVKDVARFERLSFRGLGNRKIKGRGVLRTFELLVPGHTRLPSKSTDTRRKSALLEVPEAVTSLPDVVVEEVDDSMLEMSQISPTNSKRNSDANNSLPPPSPGSASRSLPVSPQAKVTHSLGKSRSRAAMAEDAASMFQAGPSRRPFTPESPDSPVSSSQVFDFKPRTAKGKSVIHHAFEKNGGDSTFKAAFEGFSHYVNSSVDANSRKATHSSVAVSEDGLQSLAAMVQHLDLEDVFAESSRASISSTTSVSLSRQSSDTQLLKHRKKSVFVHAAKPIRLKRKGGYRPFQNPADRLRLTKYTMRFEGEPKLEERFQKYTRAQAAIPLPQRIAMLCVVIVAAGVSDALSDVEPVKKLIVRASLCLAPLLIACASIIYMRRSENASRYLFGVMASSLFLALSGNMIIETIHAHATDDGEAPFTDFGIIVVAIPISNQLFRLPYPYFFVFVWTSLLEYLVLAVFVRPFVLINVWVFTILILASILLTYAAAEREVHLRDVFISMVARRKVQVDTGNLLSRLLPTRIIPDLMQLYTTGGVVNQTRPASTSFSQDNNRGFRSSSQEEDMFTPSRSKADSVGGGAKPGALVRCISKTYKRVTMMQGDIVGFTPMCFKMEPEDVVWLLNDLFFSFDQLADAYGIYKVETIGDAYLAIAGAIKPDRPAGDQNARALLETSDALQMTDLAIAMIAQTRQFITRDGTTIQMRIGLHTGPVVGGVVGITNMPRYHFFGETTAITEKIESHGTPGAISVSEATMKEIHREYVCDYAGSFDFHGLEIKHYLVVRPAEL